MFRRFFLGKIRINKLALELNVQNDQILDTLKDMGQAVKNYMSSIDDKTADEIRELFTPKPPSKKVTPKATKKSTTKKIITKSTSKKTKATTKKKPSEKKAPKVKPKTAKITTKKSTTTLNKIKTAKTTSKPPTKDQAKQEPIKVLKKSGLKIIKHEEKPVEVKKNLLQLKINLQPVKKN